MTGVLAVAAVGVARGRWTTASTRRVVPLLATALGPLTVTLLPGPQRGAGPWQLVALAPWSAAALGTPTQVAANIALWVPLGAATTVATSRGADARWWVLCGLPVVVEIAQLLRPLGRVVATADVLLGAVGIGVGWTLGRLALAGAVRGARR